MFPKYPETGSMTTFSIERFEPGQFCYDPSEKVLAICFRPKPNGKLHVSNAVRYDEEALASVEIVATVAIPLENYPKDDTLEQMSCGNLGVDELYALYPEARDVLR